MLSIQMMRIICDIRMLLCSTYRRPHRVHRRQSLLGHLYRRRHLDRRLLSVWILQSNQSQHFRLFRGFYRIIAWSRKNRWHQIFIETNVRNKSNFWCTQTGASANILFRSSFQCKFRFVAIVIWNSWSYWQISLLRQPKKTPYIKISYQQFSSTNSFMNIWHQLWQVGVFSRKWYSTTATTNMPWLAARLL